jgi:hypothetical protein
MNAAYRKKLPFSANPCPNWIACIHHAWLYTFSCIAVHCRTLPYTLQTYINWWFNINFPLTILKSIPCKFSTSAVQCSAVGGGTECCDCQSCRSGGAARSSAQGGLLSRSQGGRSGTRWCYHNNNNVCIIYKHS